VRVILDTNIVVSALIVKTTPPALIYQSWRQGSFSLLTSRQQIEELKRTFAKPNIVPALIRKSEAGRMINHLRSSAEFIDPLPVVMRSPDPTDDFLLAMAEAGHANYLITGDKSGLLSLAHHLSTRIITARNFAELKDLL
jgi:putative PIN family toxin of toxin-antitoxin system